MRGVNPGAEPTEQILLARAYLSRVAEAACVPLWAFVREVGPLAAAAAVRSGDVSAEVRAATAARALEADPEADLAAADRHGVRLVVPESSDWPHIALAALEHTGLRRWAQWRGPSSSDRDRGELVPPLALWVRGPGRLRGLSLRSLAVVGARSATAYGDRLAKEIAHGLALSEVEIVSGGAIGIDAAAHRGALAAGGSTVLVSARGLDEPYPIANRRLFDQIAAEGALVSEAPPGARPHRHRFLSRNRLIAAFGTGTVVVEAAPRSGALNTAGHARALERIVMAVPGPVTSTMSAGCHTLIAREQNPARLVTGARDVLELVGGAGDLADEAAPQMLPLTALDRLDEVSRRVLDSFPAATAVDTRQLSITSAVPHGQVLRCLPLLLHHGLARPDGSRFVRVGQ